MKTAICVSTAAMLFVSGICHAQVPQVEDDHINAILRDKQTFYYDDQSLTQAGVHERYFIVRRDIGPPGDGDPGNPNREFPWIRTAGVPASTRVVKFCWLPPGRPIVWWRGQALEPGRGWWPRVRWMYPEGAVVGEVLSMQVGGDWLPYEVRVRTREIDDWGADVFRPVVSHDDLAESVDDIWSVFEGTRVVRMGDPNHLDHQVIDSEFRVYQYAGDEALTRKLLSRPFQSALGIDWSPQGLVAPRDYLGGLAGLDRRDCMQCHRTAGTHSDFFQQRHPSGRPRDWYGAVRGDDTVFSLHPCDPSAINTGVWNKLFRPSRELTSRGMLEHYDRAKHPTSVYQVIHAVDGSNLR